MNAFDEVWYSSSLTEKVLVVLSICAIIAGVAGNITVCSIILASKSMYTITNIHLLSLSIADLLFDFVHIARETFYYTNWSKPNIKAESPDNGFFVCLWIFKTAKNASAFTITSFTTERYLAICRPFTIQTTPNKSRVILVIIILWLVAGLLSSVSITMSFTLFRSPNPESKILIQKIGLPTEVILELLNFVIPMTSITVMYALIGIELRKSSKVRQSSTITDDRATRKALKMFVFIVAGFFFCWAPYYVTMILKTLLYLGYDVITQESKLLFYLELIQKFTRTAYPALNPMIYTLMSQKFRKICRNQLSRTKKKFLGSNSNDVSTRTNEINIG